MQANLTNRDAVEVPKPYVKYSHEPPRAADVPFALAQAIHNATLPPAGPAFVSIPMDDWLVEVEPVDYASQIARTVGGRTQPAAGADRGAGRAAASGRAAGVRGRPGHRRLRWLGCGGGARRVPAPARVGVAADRRQSHRLPRESPGLSGDAPPAVGPLAQALAGHDLVLVAGSSVFPYYPNIPGDFLAEGTTLVAITCDPDEAARAPMGEAIVADVALTLRALADELAGPCDREAPPARVELDPLQPGELLSGGEVHATLAELFPPEGIVVLESPSSTAALRNQLRLSRPGSYYFSASGGLGFGLSAAVGVQLAQPERQVVCVLGEGSAQYAITAFWTAAAYAVPVKFLVLRNNEYSILKWFATLENVTGAPALDLPALDVAATAQSYGVPSVSVSGRDELHGALAQALAQDGPRLVQVDVAPGMALA